MELFFVVVRFLALSSNFGENALAFKLATAFVINTLIQNAQRISVPDDAVLNV